jgi:hypothetical protein
MGHALIFNGNYPEFAKQKALGAISSDAIVAYHGHAPKVDGGDHLNGEIDDASLHPAFGNEYNGSLPEGRWLITKLDILCAEAIGYKVRKTFDLQVVTDSLPGAFLNFPYTAKLKAKGGLPWYHWKIEAGLLPDGLKLDPDTGIISGRPTTSGNRTFVAILGDSNEKPGSVVSRPLTISVV